VQPLKSLGLLCGRCPVFSAIYILAPYVSFLFLPIILCISQPSHYGHSHFPSALLEYFKISLYCACVSHSDLLISVSATRSGKNAFYWFQLMQYECSVMSSLALLFHILWRYPLHGGHVINYPLLLLRTIHMPQWSPCLVASLFTEESQMCIMITGLGTCFRLPSAGYPCCTVCICAED
jgi:hypothetical protein